MERIGIVGTGHRLAELETLDEVSRKAGEWRRNLSAFRERLGVPEVVLLATCNRVEVAFATHPDDSVEAVRQRVFALLRGREPEEGEAEVAFRAWAGEGAVEHLALVAAGFESARVGEAEIRLQVREALEMAHEAGVTGSRLDHAFELALRLAKRVQHETQMLAGPASIADMAMGRLAEHLRLHPGRVALVGVSPMTRVCFKRLMEAKANVLVANRTIANATEMVEGTDSEVMALDAFRADPPDVTTVIVALSSTAAEFSESDVRSIAKRSSGSKLLIVDFGMPPTVPQATTDKLGLDRFGMDDMIAEAESERHTRLLALAPARAIIEEGLDRYREGFAIRSAGAAIQALETHYQDLAVGHTRAFLRRQCKELTAEQQDLVEQLAGNLARKFAHVPARGVRALAADFGISAVRGFLAASDKGLEGSLTPGQKTPD